MWVGMREGLNLSSLGVFSYNCSSNLKQTFEMSQLKLNAKTHLILNVTFQKFADDPFWSE